MMLLWFFSEKIGTPSSTRVVLTMDEASAVTWTESGLRPKNGGLPGIHMNGRFSSSTILLPKDRTRGQSSITWNEALPNVEPGISIQESLTYVPFPVSNLIGLQDWVQLCTKDMGTPCSRNARSDAKSRPAPESAIQLEWVRHLCT